MSGGLLELVAHGVQDIYLIGNPQITFFKVVYKRHTNFSMESIRTTFDGDINFGKKITATLSRSGDLAYSMILEIDLPLIESTNAGTTGGGTISYVNSLGHALIDYIDIEIGGSLIDRQYGEWMEIWNQLSMNNSQKFGYDEMLSRNDNFATVSGPLTVYIPLQFWFNRNIGLALPLVALQYHEVNINIQLNPLSKIYTFGDYNYYTGSQSGTTVTITSNTPEFDTSVQGKIIVWNDGTTSTIGTSGYISSSQVTATVSTTQSSQTFYIKPDDSISNLNLRLEDARLYTDYIYLDTYERKQFASIKHRYLIEQIQFNGSESFASGSTNKKFDVDFNLPMKAIYWISQLETVSRNNDVFNFSDTVDPNATKSDPISKVVLLLNGTERFAERNGKYFRLIQPFQKHTRVPNDFIYMYSFCLKPENHQPSGTCNFSKIDSSALNVTYNSSIGDSTFRVYGLSYNILRVFSGMGGLAFSN
jgi:hypothetical protein